MLELTKIELLDLKTACTLSIIKLKELGDYEFNQELTGKLELLRSKIDKAVKNNVQTN